MHRTDSVDFSRSRIGMLGLIVLLLGGIGTAVPQQAHAQMDLAHYGLVWHQWVPVGDCPTFPIMPSRQISAIAEDAGGELYFFMDGRVYRMSSAGTVRIVAGNGVTGFSGDDGPALDASFGRVQDLAFDSEENLYLADTDNHRVRRVDRQGRITTVDSFVSPKEIAFDATGSMYVLGAGKIIVRTPEGVKETYHQPVSTWPVAGLAVDPEGRVYTATEEWLIRVNPDRTETRIQIPRRAASDVAADAEGNLYVAMYGMSYAGSVYKVSPAGEWEHIAGSGCYPMKGSPCTTSGAPPTETYIRGMPKLSISPHGMIAVAPKDDSIIMGFARLSAPGLLAGRPFPSSGTPAFPSSSCTYRLPYKGDVSLDDRLDVQDAVLTLRIITGLTDATELQRLEADVTQDHSVDVFDVVRMLKRIVTVAS